jgi:biotin transport system ATP-binding protein
MINIKDLTFQYDTKGERVLNRISLNIEEGKHLGIIGSNGCGKTTLVRHLDGLLSPTAGDVWVEGMNTKDRVDVQKIRQIVGMVFQNPDNQIVGMSVEEDVSFGPGNLGLPPVEIRKRVEASLAMVGMEKHAKRPPHTLSNGEKQLVAIAGVLAMEPKYIVLDEPTTYLDPCGRKKILQVITKLNKQGITIIHVTHDMDEIAEADEIAVLHKGGIALREKPAEVFARVEWLRSIGVDIPRVTDLMWQLRQMGKNVRTNIFTLEDACMELSSLIKAKTS